MRQPLWLVSCGFALALAGCGPQFTTPSLNPGPPGYQRTQAVQYDPFPETTAFDQPDGLRRPVIRILASRYRGGNRCQLPCRQEARRTPTVRHPPMCPVPRRRMCQAPRRRPPQRRRSARM